MMHIHGSPWYQVMVVSLIRQNFGQFLLVTVDTFTFASKLLLMLVFVCCFSKECSSSFLFPPTLIQSILQGQDPGPSCL